jgi:hypothetical protein
MEIDATRTNQYLVADIEEMIGSVDELAKEISGLGSAIDATQQAFVTILQSLTSLQNIREASKKGLLCQRKDFSLRRNKEGISLKCGFGCRLVWAGEGFL